VQDRLIERDDDRLGSGIVAAIGACGASSTTTADTAFPAAQSRAAAPHDPDTVPQCSDGMLPETKHPVSKPALDKPYDMWTIPQFA
jgi:hypothetical protein